MVYLHTTSLAEVQEKFVFGGSTIPEDYLFTLFKPTSASDLINVHAIDESFDVNYYNVLVGNFDYLFNRGDSVSGISPFLCKDSYKTFTPSYLDVTKDDFLAFTRIFEKAIGVFWITKNFQVETPAYWEREVSDPINIKITGKMTRGACPMGSPFYQTRGSGVNIGYNQSNDINSKAINENSDPSSTISVSYEDSLNPSFVVDRSGKTLVTSRTLQ
jgi:hypothetical protein